MCSSCGIMLRRTPSPDHREDREAGGLREHLSAILDVADGVMVARGDLGVELALEKVPRDPEDDHPRGAPARASPVITATQMLESMIEHPRPTRAEVSDVANAIYDGTDAVMLSAETSAGKYPVEAVRMMDRIAVGVRRFDSQEGLPGACRTRRSRRTREILADAAYRGGEESGAAAIVVFTSTGSSARLVSRYRPPVRPSRSRRTTRRRASSR